MPSALGRGIDKALREMEEKKDENLDYSEEEYEKRAAILEEVYRRLQPTLKEIRWWGTISEAPVVLAWAIHTYKELERDGQPATLRNIDGETYVYSHGYAWPILEGIVHYTKKWQQMSENEKKAVYEHSRNGDKEYQRLMDEALRGINPRVPVMNISSEETF